MLQLDLLNPPVPAPVRCDPRVPADAKPRPCRQARMILARLQQGTVTNRELSEIALKYTNRISEIRKSGHNVVCVTEHATGHSEYYLGAPKE